MPLLPRSARHFARASDVRLPPERTRSTPDGGRAARKRAANHKRAADFVFTQQHQRLARILGKQGVFSPQRRLMLVPFEQHEIDGSLGDGCLRQLADGDAVETACTVTSCNCR